ncbi:hypothetical protein J7I98_08300 [Streptomyces sp. ISL-98]|uniref:hypothetical protein n=1 Tax=Streptomyces sp. ISL-98 TaxID=2819192 RepID=UPI001BE95DD2|nr:hypothetical protein [Streptomyces sp. ISL-98]MBT2505900.1 hypothetical protein [Streptomyces sp. ISL-98]
MSETGAAGVGTKDERAMSVEPSLSNNTWPVVFLGPALMLLRFFGEHAWAYWTAAVIGSLGVLAAAVEIVATVRALVRGRQPLVAIWVIVLLAGASWVMVRRLVEG